MVEGGHRTRLRNDHEDQLVCHGVPPAPVYKGARGRPPALALGAPRGSLTPTGSRTPTWTRRGKGGKWRRRGKRGAPPPFPCPIRTRRVGRAATSSSLSSLLSFGPLWPNNPPGGSGNPPVLR